MYVWHFVLFLCYVYTICNTYSVYQNLTFCFFVHAHRSYEILILIEMAILMSLNFHGVCVFVCVCGCVWERRSSRCLWTLKVCGEAQGGVVIWWEVCRHKFLRGQLRGKLLEKLASFEKLRWNGKEEARPGGGKYEKRSVKVFRKPYSRKTYSLDRSCFEWHNALDFMFAQFCTQRLQSYSHHSSYRPVPLGVCGHTHTGWPRPIGCLKLQGIFCRRATDCRALLRKMTCKDKASYGSWPPSIS